MQKLLHNKKLIICLGEDAKYDFGKALVDTHLKLTIRKEEAYQNVFWFYRAGEIQVSNEEDEEGNYMPSSKLPYKSILQIPKNNKIDRQIMEEKINTKIYIFEQYPYGKDTTRNLLNECKIQYPWTDIKVILWQEQRRFGATDVSDEKMALKVAEQRFNEIVPQCTITDQKEAYKELYYSQFKYSLQIGQAYERAIENLNQDMESIFEDYYYFEIETVLEDELLTLQQLDRYCKYEAVKKMDDLWESFCYNFQKVALKNNGIIHRTVFELYERMIEEICFWNMEKDRESLKKAVDQCFYNQVVQKAPKHKSIKQVKSEMEYRVQMSKDPLDVRFKEKIQSFVREDLKRCMRRYIEMKVKELEG